MIINFSGHSFSALKEAVEELKATNDIEKILHIENSEIELEAPILFFSGLKIIGNSPESVKFRAADGLNSHMISSINPKQKSIGLEFSNISFYGNSKRQSKPETVKGISFAHGMYLTNVQNVVCQNLIFDDIRQTAVHSVNSSNVRVVNMSASNVGWSGVSTAGVNNFYFTGTVFQAGLDVNHSGIHIDGGAGVYLEADVNECTGNGVMLDSTFSALSSFVVKARSTNSKRGCSLSGFAERPIRFGVISGVFDSNREVGVMISNSKNIVIQNSTISNNGQFGLLFQGRVGGTECVGSDLIFAGNPVDVKQIHASENNFIW